jgi:hypothetical protein
MPTREHMRDTLGTLRCWALNPSWCHLLKAPDLLSPRECKCSPGPFRI